MDRSFVFAWFQAFRDNETILEVTRIAIEHVVALFNHDRSSILPWRMRTSQCGSWRNCCVCVLSSKINSCDETILYNLCHLQCQGTITWRWQGWPELRSISCWIVGRWSRYSRILRLKDCSSHSLWLLFASIIQWLIWLPCGCLGRSFFGKPGSGASWCLPWPLELQSVVAFPLIHVMCPSDCLTFLNCI